MKAKPREPLDFRPKCPVCSGAGWDWERYALENLQVDDPVDFYHCQRCDGSGLDDQDMVAALMAGFRFCTDRAKIEDGELFIPIEKEGELEPLPYGGDPDSVMRHFPGPEALESFPLYRRKPGKMPEA